MHHELAVVVGLEDRIESEDLVDLAEGVGQEDARDEEGEYLLGEARHVLDDVDALEGQHHRRECEHPQRHPEPHRQELNANVVLAKLKLNNNIITNVYTSNIIKYRVIFALRR